MRVIAGKLRHRIINMTNLETTRETQDKVRGAIFNMLGQYFDGGNCLDLFAGSGAMAIEAYSRGFSQIYLNDINKDAIGVCKSNCQNLGISNAHFSNLDYEEFLNRNEVKMDLIILDPPYKMNDVNMLLEKVYNHLNKNGLIVFEMGIETLFPEKFANLNLIKNKTYGIKRVVIYEWVM